MMKVSIMTTANISYSHDLQQIKELLTSKALWPVVFALYPQLRPALQNIGNHVECPFHQRAKDEPIVAGFRLFKDIESSSPKSNFAGICNTCREFSGIDLILKCSGKDKLDIDDVKRLAKIAGMESGLAMSVTQPVLSSNPANEPTKEEQAQVKVDKAYFRKFMVNVTSEPLPAIEAYLASRGLSGAASKYSSLLSHSGDLYCNPAKDNNNDNNLLYLDGKYPSLVAEITSVDGELRGVQRIYLDNSGAKLKPVLDTQENRLLTESDELHMGGDRYERLDCKKMLGRYENGMSGCSIHFGEPDTSLFTSEGVETSIGVAISSGEPTWSGVHANMMAGMDIPDRVKVVVIFADKDRSKAGEKAANKLADRLTRKGVAVHILYPPLEIPEGEKGVDWLDAICCDGEAVVLDALDNLPEPYRIKEEPASASKPVPVKPETKKDSTTAAKPENLPLPAKEKNPLLAMESYRLSVELEGVSTSCLPHMWDVCEMMFEALNKDFCIAYLGSRAALILQYMADENRPFKATGIQTGGYYDFLKAVPFQLVENGDDGEKISRKTVNVFAAWLRWTQINRKGDVVFDPSPSSSETDYNLWSGYHMESEETAPDESYVSLWLEYIRECLCPGEPEAAEYVIRWLAHMIQKALGKTRSSDSSKE